MPETTCPNHWHCDPALTSHLCADFNAYPDRTKPCPTCAEKRGRVIAVAYTPTDGIVLHGTERADATGIKKIRERMKWYGAGGFWYVPRTRDTVQSKWRVDRIAEDLRRELPGVEITVSFALGDGVRPAEEVAADRVERAEARAERLEDRADRIAGEAAAREKTARERADMIPMGQPILSGHHSEKRDRNFREKIRSGFEKAHELREEAAGARGAAHSTRKTIERAENPGAILRRVDRLLAEQRAFQRELAGREQLEDAHAIKNDARFCCPDGPTCPDPDCIAENRRRGELGEFVGLKTVRIFPSQPRREELRARIAAIVDEVGHLRSKLPADLPGPAKFKKGDLVAGPYGTCRVERVNPKSLSVVPLQPQWQGQKYTIPYDKNPRLLGAPEKKETP